MRHENDFVDSHNTKTSLEFHWIPVVPLQRIPDHGIIDVIDCQFQDQNLS